MSGILSLFFCGITMRHYTWHNLSPAAQAPRILFRALACLCDAALSLLLGIAFVDYVVEPFEPTPSKIWNFALIGTGVLVTRLLNIVPMSAANCAFRKRRIGSRCACRPMWFSALRGSISFALAMTLDSVMEKQIDSSVGKPIVTTTLAIILMTNMAMAPLTPAHPMAPPRRCRRRARRHGLLSVHDERRRPRLLAAAAAPHLGRLVRHTTGRRRWRAAPSRAQPVGTRDGTLASCIDDPARRRRVDGISRSASVSVAVAGGAAAARRRRRAPRRASRRRWRARARRLVELHQLAPSIAGSPALSWLLRQAGGHQRGRGRVQSRSCDVAAGRGEASERVSTLDEIATVRMSS